MRSYKMTFLSKVFQFGFSRYPTNLASAVFPGGVLESLLTLQATYLLCQRALLVVGWIETERSK